MIRYSKLFVLAMLAFCTYAAPASASEEFHAETEGVTLSGSQTTTMTFTTDSGTTHCSSVNFSGTQSAKTALSISLTSTTSGCQSTGFISASATTHINNCTYIYHGWRQFWKVTTVPTDASKGPCVHTYTYPFCTVTVNGGQSLGGGSVTNVGSGTTREIELTYKVTNIEYSESGFACKNSGSKTTGGTLSGSIRLTGSKSGHVGIWVE